MKENTIRLANATGRGRNGYFKAVDATLWAWAPGINVTAPASVELHIWSRQRGENPPILLEMDPHDAIALADALRSAARAAEAKCGTKE